MKLNDELELKDFLYKMYENFGQYSVLDFVKNRQDNGDLLHLQWNDCDGCDNHSAFEDNVCVVCGEEKK